MNRGVITIIVNDAAISGIWKGTAMYRSEKKSFGNVNEKDVKTELVRWFCTSVYEEVMIILKPHSYNSKVIQQTVTCIFNSIYYSKVWHQEKCKVQYWDPFFSADTHIHTHSHILTQYRVILWRCDTFVTWFVSSVVLYVTKNVKINDKRARGVKTNWLYSLPPHMCVWLPSLEVKHLILKLH